MNSTNNRIFSQTVFNQAINLKDGNGNPIVRRPMEKMPGVIDL
jgi:hypothetical protein